jgi:hypothetical protein
VSRFVTKRGYDTVRSQAGKSNSVGVARHLWQGIPSRLSAAAGRLRDAYHNLPAMDSGTIREY